MFLESLTSCELLEPQKCGLLSFIVQILSFLFTLFCLATE